MKGLIIHDYFCMKQRIKSIFLILPLCSAFFLLIIAGATFGNLREMDPDGDITMLMSGIFNIFMPIFAGICAYILINEKFSADKKGWGQYMFTLPVSDKMRLGAVYAVGILVSLAAFAFTLTISALLLAATDKFEWGALWLPLGIYCAMLILAFIMVAAMYILKDKKKSTAFGFATYIVFALGFSLYLGREEEVGMERLFDAFDKASQFLSDYPWILLISLAAVAAASYSISLAAMKGREKIC